MATLTKTRRILTLVPDHIKDIEWNPFYVEFMQLNEETGGIETLLQFKARDWENMGSPETITVSIEPGDHLNTPVHVPMDFGCEEPNCSPETFPEHYRLGS